MKYRYSGPPSGASLREGEAVRDVLLMPGAEVEMPADHDYTKTLIALGRLAPIPATTKAAPKGKTATNA